MKILKVSLSKIGVVELPFNTDSKGVSIEKGAAALRNAVDFVSEGFGT